MAVEDFANGANILQQVDVSQIFKSLAVGIAEAQKDLDENSIAQLQELSETELAGKSLLELGFVPAFYSFTYADISASIHLRMAEKTSLELGVKANFDFSSSSAGESDFNNLSKEHQFFSEKKEFKSNRKFSMKSSSTSSVKVNNQYYTLKQDEGAVSMIDKMHTELLLQEEIDRLNIQLDQNYTTVYQTTVGFTILKITDFGDTVSGGGVTIDTDGFEDTYNSINPSSFPNTYGFSGDQVYGLSTSPIAFELFFDFDKRIVDFAYDKSYKGILDKEKVFEALGTILRMDPSLTITIEGYTDGSGGESYNDHLSLDRSNAMFNWLLAKGAGLTQIVPHGNGESLTTSPSADPQYRKIRIVLPAGKHYIFYNSALTSISPTAPTTTDPNYFIVAPTSSTFIITNQDAENFQVPTSPVNISAFQSTNNLQYFHVEERENTLYLLHKDTELTFMTYSKTAEKIEISAKEGSQEEIRVYNTENEKERIQNLATKNRSDRTFAAGASVDFRFSRQFEMSVEGSASMSARMVAVPPPEAFSLHIATIYNPPTP